ncbi:arylsulfatase B-like [Neodiprion virginianus]|uniref:arylsulfatase B-like n=1 Tax=Neodiprion virginianus TaxID=2961670 RepID=UPI001EE71B55|nr:arylsulfatase B-like [Neodiprion virginianus]
MVLRFAEFASIASLVLAFVSCEPYREYYRREPTEYNTPLHIIVIMADDLGWNDVGFHGSNQIPTPNIDALAYNGIILNRHYTLPSCTPSRAAFLTGRYPIRMGMQGAGIKGGEPRGIPLNVHTLPEHLKGIGYVTRLIGKWHVGYHTPQHTPMHRGFDSFLGFYNSHITYFDHKYKQQNLSGFDMHRGVEPDWGSQGDYATDLFTDEAIRVIKAHDPSRPLYLQVSHLAVHPPLEVPREDLWTDEFKHIRESNRRIFAAMVSRLDDSVGQIVAALGAQHMLRDSLIVFMTDNGAASVGEFRNFGSNWPLRGTKYTLYEGGVRGVAAIWSPRLYDTMRVSDQLVHMTDWLPTLYAAAGGKVGDLGDIDGVNQWPSFSTEHGGKIRNSLLLNIDEVSETEAAIQGRYKLLRGSFNRGFYDGYQGESGRDMRDVFYNTSLVIGSAVSKTITTYLGGPITQYSAMIPLRLNASVECTVYPGPFRKSHFDTCNETECLFDIINDPCETKNIARDFPKIVSELDLFLEKYSNYLEKQALIPVDWHADPRSFNGTWQPWLSAGAYAYTKCGAAVSTIAICAHMGMVLLVVGLRAFL